MLDFLKYIQRLGFQILPKYNGNNYVFRESSYKLDFQFQLDIEEEMDVDIVDDLYIYGYIIECNSINNDRDLWHNHWNHKIYNSKKSALDAINQINDHSLWMFRVKPMYTFKNNGWRNHIINKITR